jgi:hypothetical protein
MEVSMFNSIIKILSKVISIGTLVKPIVKGFQLTWENKNTDTLTKVLQTVTVLPAVYNGIKSEIKK